MTRSFPLWVAVLSLWAYFRPMTFLGLGSFIVYLLALVMFCMGVTLTVGDFARAWSRPREIATGLLLQFTVMPALAWTIGVALALPAPLVIGMVLVGCAPGGTASNVICYLARGDLALSISLTAASTVLAVAMTPLLSWWLAGERVDVPVLNMMQSVAWMVLLPVAAGVTLNRWLGSRIGVLKSLAPGLAVALICLIIAIVVALNKERLQVLAAVVLGAVILHNLLGLILGYGIARALGFSPVTARTLSIEVGMQNSGLAVALANQFFSAAAALPGAVFSVWHNLSGSVLAAYWSRRAGVPLARGISQ